MISSYSRRVSSCRSSSDLLTRSFLASSLILGIDRRVGPLRTYLYPVLHTGEGNRKALSKAWAEEERKAIEAEQ